MGKLVLCICEQNLGSSCIFLWQCCLYNLYKLFLLSDETFPSKYADSGRKRSLVQKSNISIPEDKQHLEKRSLPDFSEGSASEPNRKTKKRRINKIRFIKVKEIHPDAPEPHVILRNEQRKSEPPKKDTVNPKGILH